MIHKNRYTDKMASRHRFILVILFLTITLPPLTAEQDSREYLSISLVTIGPGDDLYLWWGHTGFLVENEEAGTRFFYDFGNFSFNEEDFYKNFTFGRLLYMAIRMPWDHYLSWTLRENRSIRVHRLNLDDKALNSMITSLEENVRPENRDYLYHHYKDNCSTRLRDLIDTALEGEFQKKSLNRPGNHSFRSSFRLYTSHSYLPDWLLSLLQGRFIDEPVSIWDLMYIPDVLEQEVLSMVYTDASGNQVPLVVESRILAEAEGRSHETVLSAFPVLRGLIPGILLSLLILLPLLLKPNRGIYHFFRWITGFIQILWGIIGGFVGTVLTFMVFFTDHSVTYGNLNLFIINPFVFGSLWMGINLLRKNAPVRIPLKFWKLLTLSGFIMVFLELIFVPQGNGQTVAILLPIYSSLTLYWFIRSRSLQSNF